MFDGLSKAEKLKKAKQSFVDSVTADNNFQRDALEAFKFRDGEHWTDEEKRILEEEMRPALSFNLTKSSVDLVKGLNEDYRVRYVASPVEPSDAFLCEVLNDISDHVEKKFYYEDIKDFAFESAIICGRGWVSIDFQPDPENIGYIKIPIDNIPVHECRKDPASRKSDLSDARYIMWDKWLSEADFKIRYPKHASKAKRLLEHEADIEDIQTPLTPSEIFNVDVETEEDMSDYDREMDSSFFDRSKQLIRIIHMEYWQDYKRYYAFNPGTNRLEEFDGKNLEKLKAIFKRIYGQELDYITLYDKKIKWLQFIGNEILYDDDSPIPYPGFSVVPCFAFSDASGRTGYNFGIVKLMIDPQKEVNRRWSQTLNLLNNQVQPGVYAETDAFVDVGQAESSMKEAGSITWLNKGAIGEGKFKERQLPQFPSAVMQMEEFSQDIMRKITGINPDLLGMDRGRKEHGVVIRLRQQQGAILLRPLFKAYKTMARQIFERLIAIIMAYMPDAQIAKILGRNERYAIQNGIIRDNQAGLQASFRNLRELKYNVESQEVPGNKTKRMFELSMLIEMMQAGFPVDPAQVIEKLDLPATEKQRWLQFIQAQQQAQQKAAEREYQLKIAEIQARAGIEGQKIKTDAAIKAQKIIEQRQKDAAKRQIDVARLEHDDTRTRLDFLVRNKQAEAAVTNARQKQVLNR